MKKHLWVAGVALAVLVAVLVVAWIKGGTRPTGWIEVPVTGPVVRR
ncbi:hypothetical protein OLX02_11660 [Novosphingobium sp. KCTC 2891]|nr:hypothetical protein [Novosphingobium sp. KCTC 2891]MCW1383477.1 hypothetical protein [Novosphingobium sp. KCTC 2891]